MKAARTGEGKGGGGEGDQCMRPAWIVDEAPDVPVWLGGKSLSVPRSGALPTNNTSQPVPHAVIANDATGEPSLAMTRWTSPPAMPAGKDRSARPAAVQGSVRHAGGRERRLSAA